MRRLGRLVVAAVLLLALGGAAVTGPPNVEAQSFCLKNWTGGGGTDAWETAANWSPSGAPGAADVVCIDGPGVMVKISTSVTVNSLAVGSPNPAVPATLATAPHVGLTLTISGTAIVQSGGVLALGNGAAPGSPGCPGHAVEGVLFIEAGGKLLTGDCGAYQLRGSVFNSGLMQTGPDSTIDFKTGGATFDNSGHIMHTGLSLFTVGNGATFVQRAGRLELGDSFRVLGANFTYLGGEISDGPVHLSGATLATSELSGADVSRARRALAAAPTAAALAARTSAPAAGRIAAAAPGRPTAQSNTARGSATSGGRTANRSTRPRGVLLPPALFQLEGAPTALIGDVLSQMDITIGSMNIPSDPLDPPTCNAATYLMSTSDYRNDGRIFIFCDGALFNNGGTLSNYGRIDVAGLSTSLQGIVGNVDNYGTVEVAGFNSKVVHSGGRFLQTPSATFNGTLLLLGSDSILAGSGTMATFVENHGTISPGSSAGSLSFVGDVDLADGTLAMEVGGPVQGTGYDYLNVDGSITLGGTLTLSLINGYTPAASTVFSVIDAGAINGSFTTVTGWDQGVAGVLEPSIDSSGFPSHFNLTVIDTPPPPTNFAAGSSTSSSVSMNWTDGPYETAYQVAYSLDLGATYLFQDLAAEATAATISGLPAGQPVYTWVRACRFTKCSAFAGAIALSTPGAVAPPVPASFRTGAITSSSLQTLWDDGTGETLYQSAYSTDNGATWSFVNQVAGSTSFTLSGLSSNVRGYFTVRACAGFACSAFADVLGMVTSGAVVPPVVTNLHIGTVTDTSLEALWDDGGPNETEYLLAYTTDVGLSWTVVPLPADTTAYTVSGLAPGQTVYFSVSACNGPSCSAYCTEVPGTTSGGLLTSQRGTRGTRQTAAGAAEAPARGSLAAALNGQSGPMPRITVLSNGRTATAATAARQPVTRNAIAAPRTAPLPVSGTAARSAGSTTGRGTAASRPAAGPAAPVAAPLPFGGRAAVPSRAAAAPARNR